MGEHNLGADRRIDHKSPVEITLQENASPSQLLKEAARILPASSLYQLSQIEDPKPYQIEEKQRDTAIALTHVGLAQIAIGEDPSAIISEVEDISLNPQDVTFPSENGHPEKKITLKISPFEREFVATAVGVLEASRGNEDRANAIMSWDDRLASEFSYRISRNEIMQAIALTRAKNGHPRAIESVDLDIRNNIQIPANLVELAIEQKKNGDVELAQMSVREAQKRLDDIATRTTAPVHLVEYFLPVLHASAQNPEMLQQIATFISSRLEYNATHLHGKSYLSQPPTYYQDDAQPLTQIGRVLGELGATDQAIVIKGILETRYNPIAISNPEAEKRLALEEVDFGIVKGLIKNNNLDQARKFLETYPASEDPNELFHANVARVLLMIREGKTEEAIERISSLGNKSVQRESIIPVIEAITREGNVDDAIRIADAVTNNTSDLHLLYTDLYTEAGEFVKAQKAIERIPITNFDIARDITRRLERLAILKHNSQPNKAE